MKSPPKIVSFIHEYHLLTGDLDRFNIAVTYKDEQEFYMRSSPHGTPKTTEDYDLWLTQVPGYLQINYTPGKGRYLKTFNYLKGFSICLDGHDAIGGYMQSHFNKKSRGNILRALRRLEHSYAITYDRYFGEIEPERCASLLELLRKMIISRFKVRGEESATLPLWEKVSKTLFHWIIEKKASLFVISHDGKPICISVSYHNESIFNYYITSFDISYSKFSLGNIMLYKQLEWCLAVGSYRFFEMGWGDLDYKRKWCNYIHDFKHHLILSKNFDRNLLQAMFYGYKANLIVYLIDKPVYKFYRWIKKLFTAPPASHIPEGLTYSLVPMESQTIDTDKFEIIQKEHFQDLQLLAVLNDFLYLNEERYSDTRILKDPESELYFIRGSKHIMKIQN